MKIIGEIKAILNENHLVIQVSDDVSAGDELSIVGIIKNEKIKNEIGLDELYLPKGKVKVMLKQKDDLYLASIAIKEREIVKSKSRFLNPLANILGETEIIETVPVEKIGTVESSQSLKVELFEKIKLEDKIVRL